MHMYKYLKSIIFIFIGFILGMKYSNKEIIKISNISSKHWKLYEIAIRWIRSQENIERYIVQNEYKRVCIYGMSHLGDCLTDALRKVGIEVVYGIDKNADKLYNQYIPIYKLSDNLPTADLIIVTTIMHFEEIKSELEKKFEKEISIVSLEEVLAKLKELGLQLNQSEEM